jgi:hypothetical protein
MRSTALRDARARLAAALFLAVVSVLLALGGPGIGVERSGATLTDTETVNAGSLVTRAACTTPSSYAAAVTALNPTFYWRFSEAATATTVADSSGNGNVGTVVTSSPTAGVAAPLTLGVANSGLVQCDGTGLTSPSIPGTLSSGSYVVWPTARPNADTFTIMAWVRTTSTTGGRIIGQGSSTWAKDKHYDRMIFLDNAGHAVFGLYPKKFYYLRSSLAVNDGKPHLLAATLGPAGAALYVDGVRDQFDPSQYTAEYYKNNETTTPTSTTTTPDGQGYWRVGWDNLAGWKTTGQPQPTDFGLNGVIDEAALFEGTQLTDAQIAGLWAANHW